MVEHRFDAARLAESYRLLVLWVGVQLLASLIGPVLVLIAGENLLGLLIAVARLLVILVTIVALGLYAYRTAQALGSKVSTLWAIAMLIPLVNLITLLVLSSKATRACRAVGIEVGLLGPKLSTVTQVTSDENPG